MTQRRDPTPPGAGAGAGTPCDSTVTACPRAASYPTMQDAARAALNDANPTSIRENREYGGLIYRNPDGTYGYTAPNHGSGTSYDPSTASVPPGTTRVGDYHTHGDYSTDDGHGNPVRTNDPALDAFNSDNFSTPDLRGIEQDAQGNPDYRGYLGTPSGTFREYDPGTRTQSTL